MRLLAVFLPDEVTAHPQPLIRPISWRVLAVCVGTPKFRKTPSVSVAANLTIFGRSAPTSTGGCTAGAGSI
jgi:hypothetical protein